MDKLFAIRGTTSFNGSLLMRACLTKQMTYHIWLLLAKFRVKLIPLCTLRFAEEASSQSFRYVFKFPCLNRMWETVETGLLTT
jgi:hypothetical protein